ncbi:MAG: hypothetical protein ABH891_02425 [Candidatus Omnitrophota bacterium]
MKILKTVTNQKGFVLLVAYMVVIFVAIFSAVFFARHQVALQAMERYQNRVLAFNAAEAGIDFALRELATDPSRRTGTASTAYTSPDVTLGQHAFRYTISPVTGQSAIRRIDAEGCAPSCDADSRAYQTSNITVYSQITEPAPPPALFEYGIYAKDSITLDGLRACAFDSYNSNQGAYGGSNISSEGAIAADTAGAGKLYLKNTTVNGSAQVKEDANPNIVIELKKAEITGSKSTMPEGWELPEMPALPETHTDINLSNVTGSITPLPAGTYHCTSIKISGGGTVPTTGPVSIYVDGPVDVAGNGITVPNNHPGNLTIFATGSVTVKLAGNGSFYGGIFAPNSDVIATGNGDIFGAIVSKNFSSTGNGAVHFDLAMKEGQPVDPNQTHIVRITAWQELNSLAWGTGKVV